MSSAVVRNRAQIDANVREEVLNVPNFVTAVADAPICDIVDVIVNRKIDTKCMLL